MRPLINQSSRGVISSIETLFEKIFLGKERSISTTFRLKHTEIVSFVMANRIHFVDLYYGKCA